MPKGSRRAPNVYRRVHSRPRHTAQWVGLFFQVFSHAERSRSAAKRNSGAVEASLPSDLLCPEAHLNSELSHSNLLD